MLPGETEVNPIKIHIGGQDVLECTGHPLHADAKFLDLAGRAQSGARLLPKALPEILSAGGQSPTLRISLREKEAAERALRFQRVLKLRWIVITPHHLR